MKTHLLKRLYTYSSVAGLTAISASANAGLVYTDMSDITLNQGDQFLLDLNQDGVIDYEFRMTTYNAGLWAAVWPGNNEVVGYRLTFTSTQNNSFNGSDWSGWQYASVFNAGSSVTSMNFDNLYTGNNTFIDNTGSIGLWFYLEDLSTYPLGGWDGQKEKYLGIRFDIDSVKHYGWVQISAGDDHQSYTIHSYAYEDEQGVRRAKMGEPLSTNNIEELNAAIYSFGNIIAISGVQGSVSVYDLSGREVHQSLVTAGTNSITLGDGIYVVKVSAEGKTKSQKVSLGS